MRKALDLMEAERLVTRRQGRGTFVNDQTADELAVRFCNIRTLDGQRVAGEFREEEIAEGGASEIECRRLGMGANDLVYRIRRTRIDNDRTFMVEDVALPAALFPNLAEEKKALNHIVTLAQQHGVLLGRTEERMSIGAAVAEVAKLLNVTPNSAVLVLDRVTYTLDGRQAEWRIGYCHFGNEYTYLAEMK